MGDDKSENSGERDDIGFGPGRTGIGNTDRTSSSQSTGTAGIGGSAGDLGAPDAGPSVAEASGFGARNNSESKNKAQGNVNNQLKAVAAALADTLPIVQPKKKKPVVLGVPGQIGVKQNSLF